MKMPMPQLGMVHGMYQAARMRVGISRGVAVYPNIDDMARKVSSACNAVGYAILSAATADKQAKEQTRHVRMHAKDTSTVQALQAGVILLPH